MTAPQADTATDPQSVIAALQQRLDATLAREATLVEELAARGAALGKRNRAYDERIAHQSATIDVLRVMSASPGDTQPVFDLIVRQARAQCNSASAILYEYDGMIHCRSIVSSAVSNDALETYVRRFPMPLEQEPNIAVTVSIRDQRIVHVRDANVEPNFISAIARSQGVQSGLAVPLIRAGRATGCIALSETRIGGFSDSQIELLKTFAEQAVIAITSAETYRALQERTAALAQRNTEYGERIEHQSATIDVLKAMSASPGDPQPVFDLIVDRARDLCDAYGAIVFEFDGTRIHWRAATGVSDDPAVRAAYEAQFPMVPTRDWAFGRAILDRRIIRIDDMEAEPGLDPTLRGITAKSNVTTR